MGFRTYYSFHFYAHKYLQYQCNELGKRMCLKKRYYIEQIELRTDITDIYIFIVKSKFYFFVVLVFSKKLSTYGSMQRVGIKSLKVNKLISEFPSISQTMSNLTKVYIFSNFSCMFLNPNNFFQFEL